MSFLPFLAHEVTSAVDFILMIPEAYVDHPSFGHAIISRVIESQGFTIAINSQPKTDQDYEKFGRPKIAFMISGGVVDSMVNNYTVAKSRRKKDEYSAGGHTGNRPDRAVTVYSRTLKRIYPDVPIIIGGIEASLRRMAHYDYWDNAVKPSILVDSWADLLVYGMGERALWNVLTAIKSGVPVKKIKDINGTAFLESYHNLPKNIKEKIDNNDIIFCPSLEEVSTDRHKYVEAFKLQAENSNYLSGKMLAQKHRNQYVIVHPPARPLTVDEMDQVYALPYMLRAHDSYKQDVPAIAEVRFSITSHRGCFGNCSYCALSFHQGRAISKRSKESIVAEAKKLISLPDFKGYIHDIGGPTANFRNASCAKQETQGVCKDRQCIGHKACPSLIVSHQEYLDVLRTVRNLTGVKKVFIRSGIRYDYMLMDSNNQFFEELVEHHISGQLKVAPEHCSDNVLRLMNKPRFSVYEEFKKKYQDYNIKFNKQQFLVPYLISSHPGCTLDDALALTAYLKKVGRMPEQVQDFYPTPATKSTCMFYTGIDPDTGKEIFVPRTTQEKVTQRALLQYNNPKNKKIIAALSKKGLKHK